ncbi:uncharacterized protein Socs44A [Drosophila virilis]|uniref:Uncharacterized protein n=1 Tax=Drosophila virilis TaxID=7244 RepID=B4LJM5_DROVI|nr:uncharacterized protein LOC6627249 [Drosophila virilis]EDW61593.1 uncharacterized protein Dvir_GJ22133 [Drosophila virilis]
MSNGENKTKSRSQNQGQGAADGNASGSQAAPTAIGSTERNRPSTAASQGMLAAGSTEQSSATTTASKEKRSWFHSLTRRKKSDSALASSSSTVAAGAHSVQLQNNNNEPIAGSTEASSSTAASVSNSSSLGGALRKRKDKKNMFSRIRKKMGLGLNALRNWHSMGDDCDCDGGTTDAMYEFLAPPIRVEPSLPFTHDYKRFIRKKWMERQDAPNEVMYKACLEMLNQVWYWGEISRRDSQRQLSDKPTGSFLVRDSETSGSQFTLSFRIVNVTLHYRLEYRDEFWHFEELKYESIVDMIKDILHRCTNDNFVCFVKVPNEMQPPFPVILKYPLSRYLNMPKLQDLCRRVLQSQMTVAELAQLPVPAQMLEYLSVERELVFQS